MPRSVADEPCHRSERGGDNAAPRESNYADACDGCVEGFAEAVYDHIVQRKGELDASKLETTARDNCAAFGCACHCHDVEPQTAEEYHDDQR